MAGRESPMTIAAMLEELMIKAVCNPEIRLRLLETRMEKNPVDAFCKVCQKMGYPMYEMDLISEGEEFYAAMKRSTNGGGENSPMLDGQDDFYEMFFAELENMEK